MGRLATLALVLALHPGAAHAVEVYLLKGDSSVLIDTQFTEGGPIYPDPETNLTLTEDGSSGSLHFFTVESFFVPTAPAGAGAWTFRFGAGGVDGSSIDLQLTWDDSTGHFFSDTDQNGTPDAITLHGDFATIVPQKSAEWDLVFTSDEAGASLPTACGSNVFTTAPDGRGIPPGPFSPNGAGFVLASSACAQNFTPSAGLDEAGLIVHLQSIIPLPEPGFGLQIASGLLALAVLARRRRRG